MEGFAGRNLGQGGGGPPPSACRCPLVAALCGVTGGNAAKKASGPVGFGIRAETDRFPKKASRPEGPWTGGAGTRQFH